MENAIKILLGILTGVGITSVLALIFGAISVFATSGKGEVQKKQKPIQEEKTDEKKKVAFVRCGGGNDSSHKYTYTGANDCAAAELVAGGPKNCIYACLGLGSCVYVCKTGAMSIKGGVAVVDEEKCIGCGACAEICPRSVVELVPADAAQKVRCRSVEQGSELRKICDMGCIGCMACAKTCKYDAIKVTDNIASVDYEKCVRCGECAEVCPRGIITTLPKIAEITEDEDREEDVKEIFDAAKNYTDIGTAEEDED